MDEVDLGPVEMGNQLDFLVEFLRQNEGKPIFLHIESHQIFDNFGFAQFVVFWRFQDYPLLRGLEDPGVRLVEGSLSKRGLEELDLVLAFEG